MVRKAIKGDVKARVIIALIAVYVSWGSTYLAIRIALKDFQPFFMMGIRFLAVGTGLFLFLRVRGAGNAGAEREMRKGEFKDLFRIRISDVPRSFIREIPRTFTLIILDRG
jgi:drug/metabolite transporter (DMT)-like permease